MNFRKKGWLKKYTDLRAGQPFFVSKGTAGQPDTVEKSLYRFLQPTGLFYGFPIQYPLNEAHYPQDKYYATSDKAHIIFLDCLFGCLMASGAKEPTTTPAHLKKQFSLVADYFGVPATTTVQAKGKWLNLFSRSQAPEEQLEKTLKKHLNFGAGLTSFSVYFANSLLFLDIYGCMRYGTLPQLEKPLETVKAEQEQLRVTALKLIAAAAHANGIIEKEESQIYFQFLRSAKLPAEKAAYLREVYKKGISLAEVEIPETSWLVKRYLLEVAILTIMSDNDVSAEEEVFLSELCTKLGLEQDDLDQGMAALQTFLLVNEPHLHFFKDKSRFTYASERLKERISKVIALNKDRILQEIEESKEMVALIQKSKRTALSAEEKTKVRQQLFDILKTVPMLAMLLIPGKMLIMPLLLQILPAEIYPSAFRE